MNLYIRTLGFDNMTSEAEAKFIKTGIRESIKEGFVIRHEKLDRGVIILRLSNSTGLYVYGRYEKNVFKYEYYFPFVVGKALSDNEEMTIASTVFSVPLFSYLLSLFFSFSAEGRCRNASGRCQ